MVHRAPGCGLEVVVGQALDLLEAKLLAERFGVGKKPRRAGTKRGVRKVTRHVPRSVTREVFARDGLRCAYVDPTSGRRCAERAVELQHHEAFALGGEHSADNVSLFCKGHNAYAARRDFGREHIEAAIEDERRRREARRSRHPAPREAEPAEAERDHPSSAARPAVAIQLGMFGS